MSQSPVTIDGDPQLVEGLSRLFSALHQVVDQAATTTHTHRSQLDSYWQGKGSEQATLALSSVENHLAKSEPSIAQAVTLLHQYSQDLAAAQQKLNSAVNHLAQLQTQLSATPGDATLQQQVTAAQQQVDAVVAAHKQDAQRVAHSISALDAPPVSVTPHGNLNPVDALLLDDAVAHHKLSKNGAAKAASRLASVQGSQAATLSGLLATASAKNEAKILSMLAAGKSVKQINSTVGTAKYLSLTGPGEKLNGKVSWFDGPAPHGALGVPLTVPGIAVYNQATLGGYWLVEFPNGRSLVLQQTDIGPAPWTGRVIDVTVGALGPAGYSTSNFPTDSTVHARYLGKSVPPGVVTK